MFTGARNVRSCAENWPNCDCRIRTSSSRTFGRNARKCLPYRGSITFPSSKDGDVVLSETDAILAHLESKAEAGRPANG